MSPRTRLHLELAAGAILLFALSAYWRVFDLGSRINIDGVGVWIGRAIRFHTALATDNPQATFQHHPGVTLMWLAGYSLKAAGNLRHKIDEDMVVRLKLPLAWICSTLPPITFLALRRYMPSRRATAWFAGLLMATEPFFVAHNRSFHLDGMLATFTWTAVLLALVARGRSGRVLRWTEAAVAGICLGLGVLTKVPAGAIAVGLAAVLLFLAAKDRRWAPLQVLTIVVVASLATAFALWPALADDPVRTFRGIFHKAVDETESGHSNLYFGTIVSNPGWTYYAVALVLRSPPESVALGLAGMMLVFLRWKKGGRELGWIWAAYLLVIVFTWHSPKKGDRYMVPMLPLWATTGAFAMDWLAHSLARWAGYLSHRWRGAPGWAAVARQFSRGWTAIALALVFLAVRSERLAEVWPLPITYSVKYGSFNIETAFTVGWGEGMKDAIRFVQQDARKYGLSKPKVYGGGYTRCAMPFGRFSRSEPEVAEYIIHYISDRQRLKNQKKVGPAIAGQEPIHRVTYDGIDYARIYLGPRHPLRRGRVDGRLPPSSSRP